MYTWILRGDCTACTTTIASDKVKPSKWSSWGYYINTQVKGVVIIDDGGYIGVNQTPPRKVNIYLACTTSMGHPWPSSHNSPAPPPAPYH